MYLDGIKIYDGCIIAAIVLFFACLTAVLFSKNRKVFNIVLAVCGVIFVILFGSGFVKKSISDNIIAEFDKNGYTVSKSEANKMVSINSSDYKEVIVKVKGEPTAYVYYYIIEDGVVTFYEKVGNTYEVKDLIKVGE